MSDEPLPTVFKTTAQDPVARANPHPRLDRLRRECPVLYDGQLGGFFLTRHEDVRAVLSDRSMLRDPERAVAEARAVKLQRRPPPPESRDFGQPPAAMLFLDDPDHARIREPFALAFNKRVSQSGPVIQGIVDATLDEIASLPDFDVVTDFAQKIPIRVVSRLIGIPDMSSAEFQKWSEGAALALHPMRSRVATSTMIAAQNALHDFFHGLITERRLQPEDDLVSDLVAAQKDGAAISDHEIQSNLRLLLVAGNLTTSDLIGSAVWLLLTNPLQLNQLRRKPVLIAAVVEEALRMESPIDATDRIASRGISIGECPVGVGQAITSSLRGANRDPDVFDDPHVFRLDRQPNNHLAFGGGNHFCLGAPLARLEARIAVQGLIGRFPRLELSSNFADAEWRALPPFRGLSRLMLSCR